MGNGIHSSADRDIIPSVKHHSSSAALGPNGDYRRLPNGKVVNPGPLRADRYREVPPSLPAMPLGRPPTGSRAQLDGNGSGEGRRRQGEPRRRPPPRGWCRVGAGQTPCDTNVPAKWRAGGIYTRDRSFVALSAQPLPPAAHINRAQSARRSPLLSRQRRRRGPRNVEPIESD